MFSVMMKCCELIPKERLSFRDLAKHIDRLLSFEDPLFYINREHVILLRYSTKDQIEKLRTAQPLSHALCGTSGILGSPVLFLVAKALVYNKEPDRATSLRSSAKDPI